MSNAIYDRGGRVVGWLTDDFDVFDTSNRYIGFVEDGEAFNPRAKHLGEYADGFFWDRQGRAVGFIDEAQSGPSTPLTQLAPLEPLHPLTPIRPITPITPIAPIRSLGWSSTPFDDHFFE